MPPRSVSTMVGTDFYLLYFCFVRVLGRYGFCASRHVCVCMRARAVAGRSREDGYLKSRCSVRKSRSPPNVQCNTNNLYQVLDGVSPSSSLGRPCFKHLWAFLLVRSFWNDVRFPLVELLACCVLWRAPASSTTRRMSAICRRCKEASVMNAHADQQVLILVDHRTAEVRRLLDLTKGLWCVFGSA